jgi:hypothetical protein
VDAVQIAKSVKGVNSVTDDIDVIPPGQEVPKWHDSPLDFADGSDGGASEAGD